MINKDIKRFNDKRQKHGYWVIYYLNGNLRHRGNFINGKLSGYWEEYSTNGELMAKEYFIL